MKMNFNLKVIGLFLVITVLTSLVFVPIIPVTATGPLLTIHMLAQGGGRNDCFIIQLPDGETMVVDNEFGPELVTKLNSLGISSVKYLFGSHQDIDHIGGFNEFLDSGFPINNTKIYYPKGAINTTNDRYAEMVASATARGLTIRKLVQNDNVLNTIVDGKELSIKVLGPVAAKVDGIGTNDYDNQNDASLILKVTYGNKKIIFMGDARQPTETDLLNTVPELLQAQIVKVGHHGVSYDGSVSCSDAFLNKVNPTKALITNGDSTINSGLITNLQERNINYWTTGTNGYTVISTDGISNWTAGEAPTWP